MTNTHNELLGLAERVEGATGPDRELDCLIGAAIDLEPEGVGISFRRSLELCGMERMLHNAESYQNVWRHMLPRYTASIDAAMTLKPDGLGLYTRQSLRGGEKVTAEVHLTRIVSAVLGDNASYSGEHDFAEGRAATLPLALVAACLRAHASLREGTGR